MEMSSDMLTKIVAVAPIVILVGGARFMVTFLLKNPFKGLFYLDIEDVRLIYERSTMEIMDYQNAAAMNVATIVPKHFIGSMCYFAISFFLVSLVQQ